MAVLLNTSLGDLVIDLHCDSCPKTCNNFLKLCKIGYYNNCVFHRVQKDFLCETGDPTGTGSGGKSIYKILDNCNSRYFEDEIRPHLKHDKLGVVAMANQGKDMNASQFYITTRGKDLDYLDGEHTVFGIVAEGLDTLAKINETYVDQEHRPYIDILIKHVSVLDDPYEDPHGLSCLSNRASKRAQGIIRLGDDWVPSNEIDIAHRLARTRAFMLEMVGDIPDADMTPPENVLFIRNLNPATEERDLEIIFARFGRVVSVSVIRDHKTGESLCYGFVEFEKTNSCEDAYMALVHRRKGLLIDDRWIQVDFSQSLAKLWPQKKRKHSVENHHNKRIKH